MTSWEIVSMVHKILKKTAKVGVNLLTLDKLAEKLVTEKGGTCVNKGYNGRKDWPDDKRPKHPFPNALVANVNSCIAHGYPTEYLLKDGDVVSFDIGVKKDGLCGDAGFTMGIGKISQKNARLIWCAKQALYQGIKKVKAGENLKNVSRAIELYAIHRGYVVNERFAGHGIGKEMHQDPLIPNFDTEAAKDYYLKEGEMICLEPMLTFQDRWGMKANEWAWVTRDGKPSVFFEHQLLVTKEGCKILTDHIDEKEIYY